MPTAVREGRPRWPITYRDWPDWRRRHAGALVQDFCASCWGQGRIMAPAANGEGLIPVRCATCAGAGGVAADAEGS